MLSTPFGGLHYPYYYGVMEGALRRPSQAQPPKPRWPRSLPDRGHFAFWDWIACQQASLLTGVKGVFWLLYPRVLATELRAANAPAAVFTLIRICIWSSAGQNAMDGCRDMMQTYSFPLFCPDDLNGIFLYSQLLETAMFTDHFWSFISGI